MVASQVSLLSIPDFGDVAAEEDEVLEYFLSTNAVSDIADNKSFLVLGRKGSGKTAIVRYFTEGHNSTSSKGLNLRGYPWNVHALRVDRGASAIEAYTSSWRYLIAVESAALVVQLSKNRLLDNYRTLEAFLTENYGGLSPQLSDILRPPKLKVSKASLQPTILGCRLGGIDLDRQKDDYRLGQELDALSSLLIKTMSELSRQSGIPSISLHFDELDQGLSRLDEGREKMLVGLILAAREVRREALKQDFTLNPVVYLRTDIWEDLQFSDKNKITQSGTLNLEWNSDSLIKLVDARIKAKIGSTLTWDDISDGALMRGSQSKWNHILARTFLRPRDVIRFLNAALAEVKKRRHDVPLFTNKDIVNCREEYSSYLKKELDDEIPQHWQYWEEALQACSAISTLTFEREEFQKAYEARRSKDNVMTADEALRQLYRFSVIGYDKRSGYGGSSWAFQYTDPEAGWNTTANRFKVHLGLKEYAKLRETRA